MNKSLCVFALLISTQSALAQYGGAYPKYIHNADPCLTKRYYGNPSEAKLVLPAESEILGRCRQVVRGDNSKYGSARFPAETANLCVAKHDGSSYPTSPAVTLVGVINGHESVYDQLNVLDSGTSEILAGIGWLYRLPLDDNSFLQFNLRRKLLSYKERRALRSTFNFTLQCE